MHIITRKRIKSAMQQHPECASALLAWYKLMRRGVFMDFADLKQTFTAVDKVKHLYVFNVGGNKIRLIAAIHFNRQKCFIRDVLNHTEYDRSDWKNRKGI